MPVSIRDVALRAGVSVGTVSNVLNRPEEVSADSVDRVSRAIDELGYVRNDAARKLRAGVSTTVGLRRARRPEPLLQRRRARRRGRGDQARHRDPLRQHRRGPRARAALPRPVRGAAGARRPDRPVRRVNARLQRLRARGIAAVLVDRFSGDGRFSSVSVDSVGGGRMAVEHLIETGRRRIAFVGGPFDIRQVNDRLAGRAGRGRERRRASRSRSSRPRR